MNAVGVAKYFEIGSAIGVGMLTPWVGWVVEQVGSPAIALISWLKLENDMAMYAILYSEIALLALFKALLLGVPLGIVWGGVRWRLLGLYVATAFCALAALMAVDGVGMHLALYVLSSSGIVLFLMWMVPCVWLGAKLRHHLNGSSNNQLQTDAASPRR